MKKKIIVLVSIGMTLGLILSIKPEKRVNQGIAFMIQNENGGYDLSETLPEGYVLNEDKSGCSNGTIPMEYNGSLKIKVTKKEMNCYLYYDKKEN